MTDEPPDEETLFRVACQISAPDARAAYLNHVCAHDSALRQRVDRLLEAHGASSAFLQSPPPGLSVTQQSPASRVSVGGRIGPYKLLQQIGEGGMGVVYMAEQSEPVHRLVALKVIKPGMDSRQVIARFEAERQALSMMDHPNIARVLDAGTSAEGQLYFAMDLVKGQPITQYCDEHQLSPRERLELMLPVCHAIQHAHQKGIIHRDIKPSNVLVAEYDERPVPRMIDFGVAKAIHQPLTAKTMFTGFGQLVGTLEYMSPEQAKVNQLDIDTRSDIYSLGVMIYELLTGTTPLEKERLRTAGWEEILRMIREEDPPCPSLRLSGSGTLPSIAANRRTEPTRLAGLLRGELDWVIMKALDKRRERRYETARHLADDLQRYLDSRAVHARPPTRTYLIRKFVNRHRVGITFLSVLMLSLVLGVIGTTIGLLDALESKRTADKASEQALIQSQLAQQNADEADEQRRVALAALQAARTAEQRADENAAGLASELERSRWLLYANQMRMVQSELLRGSPALAAGLLRETDLERRGWEFDYLNRLLNRDLLELNGHQGEVQDIAISSDGTRIATAGEDREIRVWSLATGELLGVLQGEMNSVTTVRWLPDSRHLLSGDSDGRVLLWDFEQPEAPLTIAGYSAAICGIEVASDGRFCVTASRAGEGDVRALPTGDRILDLKPAFRGLLVSDIAISPDNSQLAVVGDADFARKDVQLVLLSLSDGALVWQIDASHSQISNVTFSPDGAQLVTGSGWQFGFGAPTGIEFRDISSGTVVRKLEGSRNPVWSLVFDSAGERLFSAGELDGNVLVWDVEHGVIERRIQATAGRVSCLARDGSGRYLTGGSLNTTQRWDLQSEAEQTSLRGDTPLFGAVFDTDGRNVMAAAGVLSIEPHNDGRLDVLPNGQLFRWSPGSGESDRVIVLDACVPAQFLAGSPGGTRAASFHHDGTVRVWDLSTWRCSSSWKVSGRLSLGGIAFLDETTVCVAHDRQLDFFDTGSGEAVRSFNLPSYALRLSVGLQGHQAAVVCGNRLHLFDMHSGVDVFNREIDPAFVSGICLTPDCRRLVLTNHGGQVTMIDPIAGHDVWSSVTESATSPVMTRDGRRLIVGGLGRITLLETETGIELLSFRGNDDLITAISLSPSGDAIIAAGIDNQLQIWRK